MHLCLQVIGYTDGKHFTKVGPQAVSSDGQEQGKFAHLLQASPVALARQPILNSSSSSSSHWNCTAMGRRSVSSSSSSSSRELEEPQRQAAIRHAR